MAGARADQRRITWKVGPYDMGVASTKSGGGVAAESTKDRPGGMEDEIDYGGVVSVNDVELGGVYDLDVHHPIIGAIRALCGVQDAVVVTDQPLDKDKNVKGRPDVFKGSLSTFDEPDYDANATGEVGKYSATVSVSGPVG